MTWPSDPIPGVSVSDPIGIEPIGMKPIGMKPIGMKPIREEPITSISTSPPVSIQHSNLKTNAEYIKLLLFISR